MFEATSTSNGPANADSIAPVNPEAIAAQTENPGLWLFKYRFYLTTLGFSETAAIKWANRSVHIDFEVRKKLRLREIEG